MEAVLTPTTDTATAAQDDLLAVLQRLDRLLVHARAAAESAYGPEAAADPYRGLHIGRDEVDRLLARAPGGPVLGATNGHASHADPGDEVRRRSGLAGFFGQRASGTPNGGAGSNGGSGQSAKGATVSPPSAPTGAPTKRNGTAAGPSDLAGSHARLCWLARAFGLSRFDSDVLVIALAPELDLRYERLYAYLQDDVTRRRPTVDLALNLLCATTEEKWAARVRFGPEAPLIRHRLIALATDAHEANDAATPPLLGQPIQLDARIVDFVLGHDGVDSRLHDALSLVDPQAAWADCTLPVDDIERTRNMVAWHQARLREGEPETLVFVIHGPDGTGKRALAEAVCGETEDWLLLVNVPALLRSDLPPGEAVGRVFREAVLAQAPLYWSGFDLLLASDERAERFRAAVIAQLDTIAGMTFLAGRSDWTPAGVLHDATVVSIEVPVPPFAVRDQLWGAELAAMNGHVGDALDRRSLANQFQFGPARIRDAVATAHNRALWRDLADVQITQGDLLAACRSHSNHRLGALAQPIRPVYGWDDIVLPADQLTQLREMCFAVRHRPTVYADWGFDRKLSRGKGVNALFAGPSGTGKTMSAEIIAGDLGLDLYRIDLASVVSKYIGETEKNLDRIFGEAQTSNAILFFDEADALFGKRSEVRDAHDRYANIEISYLLQRMEEFEGIVILATNLKNNLDDAFTRRIGYTVDFPFPEEADRQRIWERVWPAETPRAADVDVAFLARQFRVAGGSIKNIALAAAFLAAADGDVVTMPHIIRATRREFQKLGKLCTSADFGPYMNLVNP